MILVVIFPFFRPTNLSVPIILYYHVLLFWLLLVILISFFHMSCIELNIQYKQTDVYTLTYQRVISHIAAGNFTQNSDDSCQVGGTTGLSRCVAVCQYRIWDSEVPYSLILSAVLTRSHMHTRWKSPVSQFQCSFLLSVALHRVPWRWSGQSTFTKTGAGGNDLSWEWCACAHAHVCVDVCVCLSIRVTVNVPSDLMC